MCVELRAMGVRLALAVVGLVGVCGHQFGSERSEEEATDAGPSITQCSADADCVLVPYFRHQTTEGHCFFAIRRAAREEFERTQQEWRRLYRLSDCTPPSHAACAEGRCTAVVGGLVDRPALPPPRPDDQM